MRELQVEGIGCLLAELRSLCGHWSSIKGNSVFGQSKGES